MNLAGIVCIRNGDDLGYCWRACIESLLPVCDSVHVSDGQSTDGTQEILRDWEARDPRIVLNVYEWPNPVGDPWWYNSWIQYAREHARADYVFQMDADEILDEASYEEVRRIKERPVEPRFSIICERLNFWKDHRHLIPHGHCCGHQVIRIAPQDMYLASDGDDPKGREVPKISQPSTIKIFHYGFIRERSKWFKKARNLQKLYFNTYDPRLEKAESYEGEWATMPGVTGWENNLIPFDGNHPSVGHVWLKENGYDA